jgi:hypothetical protein
MARQVPGMTLKSPKSAQSNTRKKKVSLTVLVENCAFFGTATECILLNSWKLVSSMIIDISSKVRVKLKNVSDVLPRKVSVQNKKEQKSK